MVYSSLFKFRKCIGYGCYDFQKQCIEFVLNARPLDRFMPKDCRSFQYKVWKLIVSKAFDNVILLMIGLNTIVLMMKVN